MNDPLTSGAPSQVAMQAQVALQALSTFLPVLYLLSAVLHGMHFGGPNAPSLPWLRRGATAVAVAAAVALFTLRWHSSDAFPVFDPWSTVSAVAFALALLHLASAPRDRESGAHRGVGAIVLGTSALAQLFASAFGPLLPAAAAADGGVSPISALHGVTSIVAAGALALSGIEGLLYLVLLRQMRRRRFGPLVQRLPSLRELAHHTRRAALAGFVLLTLGINLGIGWAHATGTQGFGYTDPWVLAMLVLWIHFGIVAFSGRIPGLSAQRASLAAAAGLTLFLAVSLLTLIPRVTFHWAGG